MQLIIITAILASVSSIAEFDHENKDIYCALLYVFGFAGLYSTCHSHVFTNCRLRFLLKDQNQKGGFCCDQQFGFCCWWFWNILLCRPSL